MPEVFSRSGVLRGHASELSVVQRLVDPALIVGVYVAAVVLSSRQAWSQTNTLAAAIGVVAFFVAAELNGLYRSWRGSPLRHEAFQAVVAWLFTVPTLLFLAFATKTTEDHSRIVTTAWFSVTPIALVGWRAAFRNALRRARVRGFNTRRVALAGSTAIGERLVKTLLEDPTLGLKIHGVYDDRNRRRYAIPEELAEFRGSLTQLVEDAKSGIVDIVYIALPLRAEVRITQIVGELADTTVTVHIVPEFYAYDLLHARWATVGDLQVVSIFDSPFQGLGGWLKRVEDLVLSTLIMALIALPMLLIAIVIKVDSHGPVFFRQRRYGLNGKAIHVLKFRTMSVMEDGGEIRQASAEDSRVTRVGRFLRRTSLDELPQFLNVLRGEMSIVGPRPHAVAHNELYRAKIHGYMLRHKVKPGITGWAQVNGWRGETDTIEKMEKRIEHDLYYIHNWRLEWDLRIIWMTVFGKASRRNAF